MFSPSITFKLRWIGVAGILLLLMALASACSSPPPEQVLVTQVVEVPVEVTRVVEGTPVVETVVTEVPMERVPGGTLTLGLATEPVSLDPAAGLYIAERFVLMDLFDTLVTADQQGGLHPGLATSWESNDEGTEFSLTLRDDVTFHDGTLFNAEAVKTAFDRIQEVEEFSTASQIMSGYMESTVVDDSHITVTFEGPKPTFISDLSQPWMGIPSPAAAMEDDFGQNPVGSGPFKFKEWAVQDHLTLERNSDYDWAPEFANNSGPALLDEIVFRFLPEPATRLSALQTGEVDVAEDPPAKDAEALIGSENYNLRTFSAPGMPAHMMINTEKPPTDDLRVRQAMIYAVNQEELVLIAFNGLQTPAHNVLSPTTFGYNAEAAEMYRYDPEKAANLLEEAGWVDTDGDGIREKDGETLKIVYPASPVYEGAYMELLAAYLNEVGFDVEITTMDDAGIFEFGVAGNHNILGMGWTSSDPGVLRYVYHSENIEAGSGFTRFVNEDLDQALEEAGTLLDPAERAERYGEAQTIIMENALAIPLHLYDRVMLMDTSVRGWRYDSEGYPWLYEVWLSGQ
jgi:peptide/nickel transport system substrate-binding protein